MKLACTSQSELCSFVCELTTKPIKIVKKAICACTECTLLSIPCNRNRYYSISHWEPKKTRASHSKISERNIGPNAPYTWLFVRYNLIKKRWNTQFTSLILAVFVDGFFSHTCYLDNPVTPTNVANVAI